MKPSQVSKELRRIAAGIDNCSTKIRRDLVKRDLRRILAAVGSEEVPGIPGMRWTEDVENTLYNALDNWSLSPGDVVVFDTVGNLDILNEKIGLNFTVTVTNDGSMNLSVGYEGSGDVAWTGTLDSFDETAKAAAASAAVELAKAAVNTV